MSTAIYLDECTQTDTSSVWNDDGSSATVYIIRTCPTDNGNDNFYIQEECIIEHMCRERIKEAQQVFNHMWKPMPVSNRKAFLAKKRPYNRQLRCNRKGIGLRMRDHK